MNCDTIAQAVPGTSEQRLQEFQTNMQWDEADLNRQRVQKKSVEATLVLQRGFTPVEAPVRCGVCDVRDTPHGFSAVDRPEFQAPTGCQTRAGAELQSTAARPEVA